MLPVTSIVAALAVVFYIYLAFQVIVFRRTNRVSLGAGDDKRLETRIRQHGNFAEYVPLSLILLGLAELQGTPLWVLLCAGLLIIIGRGAHWYGLRNMRHPIGLKMRTVGMVATFTAMIILAVTLLAITLI